MTTNTNMPPESSVIKHVPVVVYDEIEYIASSCLEGATMSKIETWYHQRFGRSPYFGSVDVKDIIGEMRDKGRVLVYDEPESYEKYVTCVWFAESLRKFLELHVEKLLAKHGGDIPLSCLEAMYKEEFKRKLNYRQFNLTGLDHLCKELNLFLEEDSQGRKVIKAVGYYLRRKRKRNGYYLKKKEEKWMKR